MIRRCALRLLPLSRSIATISLFVLITLAMTLGGCNGESASDSTDAASADGASTVADVKTQDENVVVTLEPIDNAGLDAAIQANNGKVVFVDFWATWCGPCKEGFPHTVELSRKYKDQGLAVISVSCDEADGQEGALEFLRDQQADFENFIATNGIDAIETFDIEGGALPYYRIYDRDGKLAKGFGPDPDKGTSPEEIESMVKQVLDQPKS